MFYIIKIPELHAISLAEFFHLGQLIITIMGCEVSNFHIKIVTVDIGKERFHREYYEICNTITYFPYLSTYVNILVQHAT